MKLQTPSRYQLRRVHQAQIQHQQAQDETECLTTPTIGTSIDSPIQGMCAGVPGAPTYICLATTAWHVVVYMVSVRMKSPLENACIRRPGMQSQV